MAGTPPSCTFDPPLLHQRLNLTVIAEATAVPGADATLCGMERSWGTLVLTTAAPRGEEAAMNEKRITRSVIRWLAAGVVLAAAACATYVTLTRRRYGQHRQRTLSTGDSASPLHEIASGVYWLEVGKGIMRSNVYLVRSDASSVRSDASWTLIDTGSASCERAIQAAAASVFGAHTPPRAILLTHNHPDHAGSTPALARMWGCLVYVHPEELPLITMDFSAYLPTVKQFAHPLDTWVMLPLLRVMPRRWRASWHAQATSFQAVARALDPGTGVPGLPDWECIPTPGHTPGHVSFFRPSDRVAITGDAVLTVHLNSVWSFLLWGLGRSRPRLAGPPWYTTWNWRAAKASVAAVARLEPRVLACGHGIPMSGGGTAGALRAFAEDFAAPGPSRDPVNVHKRECLDISRRR